MEELNNKLDNVTGLVKALNKTMQNGFEEASNERSRLNEKLELKIDENTMLINKAKLELCDKVVPVHRVDGHEVRIKNLEEIVF